MKYILARANRAALGRVIDSKSLLAFDFDGTLAPIVDDREVATMRATTRRLLGRLCALFPCVIVSGRSRADVQARVDPIEGLHFVGNHGLEPHGNLRRFERQTALTLSQLAHALTGYPGVELEDKRYSLAIHYRHARHPRMARAAALAALAALRPPVRVVPGKLVLNVLPRGSPHKGTAVVALRRRLGCSTAVYVGDDVTDEDVFSLEPRDWLLAIRVGKSLTSAASYYVRDQREVDALLRLLVRLRAAEHA